MVVVDKGTKLEKTVPKHGAPNTMRGGFFCYDTRKTFADLGVSPFIAERLRSLGVVTPSAIQYNAIPILRENDDDTVILGAETGSGKTIAFLVPVIETLLWHLKFDLAQKEVSSKVVHEVKLHAAPLAVLTAPTAELCAQLAHVASRLTDDTNVGVILGSEEHRAPENGKWPAILVATPSFLHKHFNEHMAMHCLFFVIDEVDEMVSDFSPHFKSLREVLNTLRMVEKMKDQVAESNPISKLPTPTIIGAAATLGINKIQAKLGRLEKSPKTTDKLSLWFKDAKWIRTALLHYKLPQHKMQFIYADNSPKKAARKLGAFMRFLTDIGLGAGASQAPQRGRHAQHHKVLVFCNDTQAVTELETKLVEKGIKAAGFTPALSEKERSEKLAAFGQGRVRLLIGTDVLSRGIDFTEVTYVVQWDMARNLTQYMHRVGRTGRAGKTGNCLSFYHKFDQGLVDAIRQCGEDTLEPAFKHAKKVKPNSRPSLNARKNKGAQKKNNRLKSAKKHFNV